MPCIFRFIFIKIHSFLYCENKRFLYSFAVFSKEIPIFLLFYNTKDNKRHTIFYLKNLLNQKELYLFGYSIPNRYSSLNEIPFKSFLMILHNLICTPSLRIISTQLLYSKISIGLFMGYGQSYDRNI